MPARMCMMLSGIRPIRVPRKKCFKGIPTSGEAILTTMLGTRGVKRRKSM